MTKAIIKKIRYNNQRVLSSVITQIIDNRNIDNEFFHSIYPFTQAAIRIGITGPPGAGKSTIINKFIHIAIKKDKSVGVVAVDPTSPFTGGALLGDRVRMNNFSSNSNIFIRSLGSRGDLGGLAKRIQDVGDVLAASGKDIVIYETVGVGQGAPLIPYFDWILFKDFGKNILSVNIGGMSNFTFIPQDGDINKVKAFDCGPGNVLINMAMQKLFNKTHDENGKIASSGALSEELFHFIISNDNFVDLDPPKSTGREQYDLRFIETLLKFAVDSNISRENVIHTLSSYTVYAIFKNYQLFIQNIANIDAIVIAGGGLYNKFVISQLEDYFQKIKVKPITNYDIKNDLKEAIGFAVLANETIKSQPSNIPSATGAKKSVILGKICSV